MGLAVWSKFKADSLNIHASALAYTSVLSLVPMFAMAYFALDAFGSLDSMQGNLQEFLVRNLAPAFGTQMIEHIQSIREKISSGALGAFGLIGFVYTSITMLTKIEHCFNGIWKVEVARSWMQRITLYWTMMTLGPIMVGIGVFLSGQGIALLRHDTGEVARLILFLWNFSPYVISWFLFSGLFILMPAKRINRGAGLISGLLTAVVFEVMKSAYALYAANALGKSVYGSLAVIPVFLIWIQLVWLIILVGAEVCYLLHHQGWGKVHRD
jgi:membrane protein